MRRTTVIILLIVAFGLGAGAGTLGVLYGTGRITAPSQDINQVAATLSLDGPTATPPFEGQIATEIAEINDNLDALATQVGSLSAGSVIESAEDNGAGAADAEPEFPEAERGLFRITQDESEARFRIFESVLGEPFEVIGTTSQIAGDVIVNFTDPAASQVGEIAINVRTLRTDNEFRDQSIRGQILGTNDNEFATFVPSTLVGLDSAPVAIGDTVEFQITGDLTVKETTRSVTFDASVTLADDERIEGFASVQILYQDFNISINPPPNIVGIEDELILELDFVALAVDE